MRLKALSTAATIATAALAALMLLGAPRSALAESYPDRTVRIIVPTSPGGSIDMVARVIAGKLSAKWGKPVVIENRPGAAMRVGVDAVAKAPADGYTLLVAHDGAMAMNPVLFRDLPYHPTKDFSPVAMIVSIPEVVMVNIKVPANSVKELIALAKKEPGKLNHATGGPAGFLAFELFKSMAGIDITSVQYRGAAPSVAAVVAGEVEVCITDVASAGPALQSDRVRTLAVTSRDRAKAFPNLPTAHETGLPGYDIGVWIGMFAPAGAPKDVLGAIETGVKEALAAPDVRSRFEVLGMSIRSGAADEMRQVLDADIAKWSALVKEKNLKIDP